MPYPCCVRPQKQTESGRTGSPKNSKEAHYAGWPCACAVARLGLGLGVVAAAAAAGNTRGAGQRRVPSTAAARCRHRIPRTHIHAPTRGHLLRPVPRTCGSRRDGGHNSLVSAWGWAQDRRRRKRDALRRHHRLQPAAVRAGRNHCHAGTLPSERDSSVEASSSGGAVTLHNTNITAADLVAGHAVQRVHLKRRKRLCVGATVLSERQRLHHQPDLRRLPAH